MIQVTDRNVIGAIHMHHWLKPSQDEKPSGPVLDVMVESVVFYYPGTSEVVVDTQGGETYVLSIDNEDLASRIIKQGEVNLGMDHPVGTTRWIKYNEDGNSEESLSMSIGNGVWLTEDSKYVWFYDIEALWEVDVEISESQSGY